MTRLFRRLAAAVALALAAVAVAAPSSLAVPVDPFDGTPYHVPRTAKKKKKRTTPNRPPCIGSYELTFSASCPVPQ